MSLIAFVALLFSVLALVCFALGGVALRRQRLLGVVVSLAAAVLLLTLGALSASISVATQGYRALTREEVAAVVETRPRGRQSFDATFTFPDGREATLSLTGDQLYVDAHILKWKPLANLLGLHTAYELDRVAGRYARLEDEHAKPRTVFSLAADKWVDMFELRRRFPLFAPLVDAEYGSAAFSPADRPATLEIRVSTTGLLVRPKSPTPSGAGG